MSAPNLVPPGTTGGGAPVGGSGTINTIPKWDTTTTLNDSVITQSSVGGVGIGIAPIAGHRVSVSGRIGGGIFGDSYIEFQGSGATAIRANNTVNIGYSNTANVTNAGLVGIGTTSPTASFQVAQGTTGINTVSNLAAGTTVTGVGTQFLDTFKPGDTVTIGGQTVAISAIASNTSMTTAAITNANSGVGYTFVGGTRFSVLGNGNVGIGTASPGTPLEVSGAGNALFRLTTTTSQGAVYQSFNAPGATSYIGQDSSTGGSIVTGALGYALIIRPMPGKAIQFGKGDGTSANTTFLDNGNVGIGTASPGYPLHVIGQVAGSSFVSTSDERDKNISGPVPHGLAFVEQLNPIAFTFKTSREDATPAGGIHYGFSAQSVLALEGDNPAIIDTKDLGNLKIHDAGLVPILVNALQELNAKFEAYVAAQEAKCL